MSTPARLHELIEPIVTGLGLELFDLHYSGSVLTVLIERPAADGDAAAGPGGRPGVDLGAITATTRAISRALDEADPITGHYSLEVSSPGLERPLRTPAHFERATGEIVSVKTVPGHDGPRRLRGELVNAAVSVGDADEPAIEVLDEGTGDVHRVPLAEIERARTVFVWGPEPKPPKPGRRKGGGTRRGADPPKNADDTDDTDDKKVSAT